MPTLLTKWVRYRFHTKSMEDYRPLIFNPQYPWWCTGQGHDFVTIVAYLPFKDDIYKYWPDAHKVTYELEENITFTDRFPKPDYYIE